MAWRRPGDKPLSEPIVVSLLTHICVTRPQWVNIPQWPSTSRFSCCEMLWSKIEVRAFPDVWLTPISKDELTRNCSKMRKIYSGQGHTSFPNDFVKPFILLSFIFKSTNCYKVFHMTHSWQLCSCSMHPIFCDLMIRNYITTKWNSIIFHLWLKISCEIGLRSYKTTKSEESRPIMQRKMCLNPLIMHTHN